MRKCAHKRWMVLVLLMLTLSLTGCINGGNDNELGLSDTLQPTTEQDAKMAWWRDARFGMFIHWGVYSVPAGTYKGKQIPDIGEWIMMHGKIPLTDYEAFAREFDPVNYDPEQWVLLAKAAGMKYIVITTKHHDGFAMFDSKVTKWDVVDATKGGKDLIKPLAEACRKHDMKLGFYYSQSQDWYHPGGVCAEWAGGKWDPRQNGDFDEYLKNIAMPQVKEILTNYGDVAVLWWDTPFDMTKERAEQFLPLMDLQPGIIMNDRLGGDIPGDTGTPEQHIPATGIQGRDWETCMTMNRTWGYKSYDHDWKSSEMLIRNLVDIASKGGNYLLNVGPTSLGEIPPASVDRLKAIGNWMDVNGDSIYGTTASPFAKLIWGRCTKKVGSKGTRLYLHVFSWPKNGILEVPGLASEIHNAYLLSNGKALRVAKTENGLNIHLPESPIEPVDTVVVVDIIGKVDIRKVLPKQNAAGNVILPAILVNMHNYNGSHTQLEEKGGVTNIGHWFSGGVTVDWDFELSQAGKYELIGDVAIDNNETHFEIKVDSQNVPVTVKSTGSYDSFKKVSLGTIQINSTGQKNLKIQPTNGWKPINIRSIQLKKIN